MSRIGKKPINVPDKVQVTINGQTVSVKGPNGNLSFTANKNVKVTLEGTAIYIAPADKSTEAKSQWGTARRRASRIARPGSPASRPVRRPPSARRS